ncbi:WAT1-related protein [Camellia lanceoleosa]|uniref:WAT1-related protein n=1 Tax=Camellia lanceoleosa TaxID=1840588 RepID=A0ACC0J0Y3_9ERIC|nr:WAT1-related protein [Camellia lanceoleosa]
MVMLLRHQLPPLYHPVDNVMTASHGVYLPSHSLGPPPSPPSKLLIAKLFKEFPYKYWATMLTCIIGSMQSTVIGLWMDKVKASWSLGWNIRLITIIYSLIRNVVDRIRSVLVLVGKEQESKIMVLPKAILDETSLVVVVLINL